MVCCSLSLFEQDLYALFSCPIWKPASAFEPCLTDLSREPPFSYSGWWQAGCHGTRLFCLTSGPFKGCCGQPGITKCGASRKGVVGQVGEGAEYFSIKAAPLRTPLRIHLACSGWCNSHTCTSTRTLIPKVIYLFLMQVLENFNRSNKTPSSYYIIYQNPICCKHDAYLLEYIY